MNDIEKMLGGLIGDAINPVSLLSKVAIAILRQRLEDGARTLRKRMANGQPWKFRDDKVASLVFDFLRAAEDGTAQINLELMAELIASGVADDGLTEESLRHLMRAVRDLSYDEMRALAALLRAQKTFALPADLSEPPTKYWIAASIYDLAWRELAGPNYDEPPEEIIGTFGALQRTGLIYSDSAWEGMKYAGTPLLAKLASLVEAGSIPTPTSSAT